MITVFLSSLTQHWDGAEHRQISEVRPASQRGGVSAKAPAKVGIPAPCSSPVSLTGVVVPPCPLAFPPAMVVLTASDGRWLFRLPTGFHFIGGRGIGFFMRIPPTG